MYRAVRDFSDIQDNSYPYKAGDEFPRKGFKVSEGRAKELLSSDNKLGKPVIEEIKEAKAEPKVEPKAEPKAEPKEEPKPKRRVKKNAD